MYYCFLADEGTGISNISDLYALLSPQCAHSQMEDSARFVGLSALIGMGQNEKTVFGCGYGH